MEQTSLCNWSASILTVAILFSSGAAAGIHQNEADAAITWINDQQHIDGSWGTEKALQPVLTSEVVQALRENAIMNAAYYQGITWLENQAVLNADTASRRVRALTLHGDDLTQPLETLTNAQRTGVAELGGWGLSAGYESSPIDTALTLVALDGASHSADTQAALDYLKTVQLSASSNGWSISTETTSDSATTAIVLSGLQRYLAQDATLATTIADGLTGLGATVNAGSPALARALTALAMLQEAPVSTTGLALLSGLITEQQVAGDWGNDVYLTATLLRAIAAANGSQGEALAQFVQVDDKYLRVSLTATLGKNKVDGLTQGELLTVTALDLTGSAISDLTGLTVLPNLAVLDLTNTNITTLSQLAGITSLTQITYQGNILTALNDLDGDGLNDLQEVNLGFDPLVADMDGDGLSDGDEIAIGTNPFEADTDNDGFNDLADVFPTDASEWLDTDSDGIGDNADPMNGVISSVYYVLNENLVGFPIEVVSLADNNTISVGNTVLYLNRYEMGVIPVTEVIQGAVITGTDSFAPSSAANGVDMPVSESLAGFSFVIPHTRGTDHTYHLMSPYGDAQVQIDIGAGYVPLTLLQGQVLNFSAGNSNATAGRIISDRLILVSHKAAWFGDAYPVPPAATNLLGIRSAEAWVAAMEDNTQVLVYANDNSTTIVNLQGGEQHKLILGTKEKQGQGSALKITADKPVIAIQVADGDGFEATAFLAETHFAMRYALPLSAQYVAVVCIDVNTVITLNDGINPPQQVNCYGSPTTPGKVYFGSANSGAHLPAGTTLESNKVVYVIYEVSSNEDERNLLGAALDVYFADAALQAAVNLTLGKNATDVVTKNEMLSLITLNSASQGIVDLTGLEHAINLQSADLSNNQIEDISILIGLSQLDSLSLTGNPISLILDADGDGLMDGDEIAIGSNPLKADTDGDGFNDLLDVFPTDPSEWLDTNGDGIGNNADPMTLVAFLDDFEDGTLAPWSQLQSGQVQLFEDPTDGGMLRKTGNYDPNGGWAPLGSTVNDFELVLYSRKVNNAWAQQNRYSLTDAAGNGYGISFHYSSNKLHIESRSTFGATELVSSIALPVGLQYGEWYTLRLTYQNDQLTAAAYIGRVAFPTSLIPVLTTTTTDSAFTGFTQVNVNGGADYDTDDVQVIDLSGSM